MASREARRIRERLTGKNKKGEKGEKKFSKLTVPSVIIILLVLFGLLWWGQTSNPSTVSVTFGSYDGRPIVWAPGNYFARQLAIFAESATNSGQRIDAVTALRSLLPYMIFHTAAMVEAEKNGLTVSDAEVEDYIKSSGALERYNKAEALERRDLFQVFKEQLIEIKLLQPMIQTFANKALENDAASMGSPEKKFKYVQWKYDDYPMQEIAKFASENKDLFRTIKLSRIVAKTESEANDAYSKIINRESTFDEQVRAVSKGEGSPELDWQSYYSLESVISNKEITNRIFALKQGEISDVISITDQSGKDQWVMYRCDKEAVPADLSSENTIAEIKNYVLQFQKGRVESYFEGEADKFLENARKNGMAAAAAGAGLKLHETGFFPINYNNLPFLKTIPNMSDSSTSIGDAQTQSLFFKEAFALQKGAPSKPILLNDLVVVCEAADERTPSQSDIDTIKNNFKNVENLDALNFYFFIADHLYARGMPYLYSGQSFSPLDPVQFHQYLKYGLIQNQGQVIYDSSRVELNSNPATSVFYNQFVDLDKMGPRADREDAINTGLEAYRQLFETKQ
ncbi:MAG: hypothetical protein JXD23_12810 [Spirochaetales bacterium]|nr:hypothetical protein [Spirochaetales bacterium]